MSDADSPIDDYLTRYAASLTDLDERIGGTLVDAGNDRGRPVLRCARFASCHGGRTTAVLPSYQQLGLASVRYKLLRQERLSDALTLVHVRWIFFDGEGAQLTDSISYYVLRRDVDGLSACVCIQTDDVDKLQALAIERGIEFPSQSS